MAINFKRRDSNFVNLELVIPAESLAVARDA